MTMLYIVSPFILFHRQRPKLTPKNLVVKEIAHRGFVIVSRRIINAISHVNVTIKLCENQKLTHNQGLKSIYAECVDLNSRVLRRLTYEFVAFTRSPT